jgi:hypothetical protein
MLDYTIVHNGEISSYDANRRYIEMFGYKWAHPQFRLTQGKKISFFIIIFAFNKGNFALPYICRFINFNLLLFPSTKPLLYCDVTEFSTAFLSFVKPPVNPDMDLIFDFLYLFINSLRSDMLFLSNISRKSLIQSCISRQSRAIPHRRLFVHIRD